MDIVYFKHRAEIIRLLQKNTWNTEWDKRKVNINPSYPLKKGKHLKLSGNIIASINDFHGGL